MNWLFLPSKYFELFKKLEWPEDNWKELVDYAHEQGIKFFADVFGTCTADMLLRIGVDGLKIHGTDMRNTRLLKHLAYINLPQLLSLGGGNIEEAKRALTLLKYGDKKVPIILMHGIQSYPIRVEDTNFGKMIYFRDQLSLPVGFADHIDGDHPLNFGLCAMAIGLGAKVIEKNITISRVLKIEDYESALIPDDFIKFEENIRGLEAAIGNYGDDLNEAEKKNRVGTRKHIVALLPIKAGQLIGEKYLTLLRTHSERNSSNFEEVIGKKANRDYDINEAIVAEDLI
ncbi:MAG: N-acetylneuraminate synthase family protein [Desulfobacterales bacterium]|nr:N-acetylneuraminate synthase family protein [Desulfobacterales bacterium]